MGKLLAVLYISVILSLTTQGLCAKDVIEIRATGLTYQRYIGPNLSWKLFASEFIKKGEEYFEAKKLYIENISKGIKINAEKGHYSVKEKRFLLKGQIKLQTEKEGEVQTEELHFYPEKDLIEAPGIVVIRKGTMEISGEGLTYRLSMGDFKLHRRAKAQFKL
ncbi:MAG: LPS export ABC transporter periplasmic protein LptC [Caldimicrobium sp.]|nr:LPS export ABC transporter periplasmic protein LptC [Caldimicrobium sp.]MCX7613487.1 LPS export ABC transporter periplasmic protein LptC [Caldimicrobium sp.]MDW8182941.1 LPS export ABC transporter periplasmic protein LptC [Caldimicrobium sp.]